MPSPAVKKHKSALPSSSKAKAVSFSSYAAAATASGSSKNVKPVAGPSDGNNDEDDDEMQQVDDDDEDEDAGEWQQASTSTSTSLRTAVAHPSTTATTDNDDDADAVMIDPTSLLKPTSTIGQDKAQAKDGSAEQQEQGLLKFPALSAKEMQGRVETQLRKVSIPPHRMTPLKRDWPKIYSPLVDECGLMVRMNVNKKSVEMKTSKHTASPSHVILQRSVDFVSAYALGFSAEDSVALLRMEDLYVETFEVKDVKSLSGDHLSRAIGRIAGKDGKTRFTIENVSRTRIVLADSKIHILGTFASIKIARDAICALILGSPPGKVYNGLRTVAGRQKQRF